MRYVAGTKDLALKYYRLPSFVLIRFTDSDYGGDRDDIKSTSTYVFRIGLGAISWASKKQPSISLSTIEAKYHVMYEQGGSSLISLDNHLAISLFKNYVFHQRTKHVEIHAHFIREKVLDGIIHLEYYPSTLNSVDLFTKPLL